jgi:prepilin-type N-terminal cleavage/methylation domain-containing protein
MNRVIIDKEEVKKMRKGFTLIEVLVVAVIVAILAAVAIPAYNGYIKSSKERVATNTSATVAAAMAAYYSEYQNPVLTRAIMETRATYSGFDGGTLQLGAVAGMNDVKLPQNFNCVPAGTAIVVAHFDGTASGSTPWY